MPTRSPSRKRRAPSPRALPRATAWWPGTSGVRRAGSWPSTTWRSVRQIAQARIATRISPGRGVGTGTSSSRNGRSATDPGCRICITRTTSRSRDDLQRAGQMGRVHHLTFEAERVHAAAAVLLEGRYQLARLLDHRLGRRERGVDDLDLRGMDGDLAAEAHGHAVLALAPEAVEVGDVRVDG